MQNSLSFMKTYDCDLFQPTLNRLRGMSKWTAHTQEKRINLTRIINLILNEKKREKTLFFFNPYSHTCNDYKLKIAGHDKCNWRFMWQKLTTVLKRSKIQLNTHSGKNHKKNHKREKQSVTIHTRRLEFLAKESLCHYKELYADERR